MHHIYWILGMQVQDLEMSLHGDAILNTEQYDCNLMLHYTARLRIKVYNIKLMICAEDQWQFYSGMKSTPIFTFRANSAILDTLTTCTNKQHHLEVHSQFYPVSSSVYVSCKAYPRQLFIHYNLCTVWTKRIQTHRWQIRVLANWLRP